MRTEPVEIYSDPPGAIMRHPGRRFPGVLVQGDTLHTWCSSLDLICAEVRGRVHEDTFAELNDLRNRLWSALNHYKEVLDQHGLPVPFSEAGPRS